MMLKNSNPSPTFCAEQERFGYYEVGTERFHHKPTALMRAAETGIHPEWHFHQPVFSQLDWTSDRVSDLKNLYQQRAQQLRSRYDYLVVSFSGGSDSWTVIKAFLDSGTHLDEVFVRWPIKASVGQYTVSRDPHPINILSEWELALLPQLQYFQDHMPNTKFTVLDWSDEFISKEFNDDQWYLTNDMLNPGLFLKYNSIGAAEMQAIESGKKTCMIYAVDKPQMCMSNGNIYCYFLDKLANKHPNNDFERTSELFYWSPDFPEITWSQARAMYRFVLSNPKTADLIDWTKPYNGVRKSLWDRLVRGVIYQDYEQLNLFQADKGGNNVYADNDAWMMDHQNLLWMQSWESGLRNLFRSIDHKWLEVRDGQVQGFRGFINGWYNLGPAPQVDQKPT